MCVLFNRTSEPLGKARWAHQVVAGTGVQYPHRDALGGRRLTSRRRRPGLSLSTSAASRLADRARGTRLSRSARRLHLRSHRRGLAQEVELRALLAAGGRVVEVPADALALAFPFSFAFALSFVGTVFVSARSFCSDFGSFAVPFLLVLLQQSVTM